MSAITKQLMLDLTANVELKTLGNSHRSLRDLAADLINASKQSYAAVAKGSFLHEKTVENLATGHTKRPQSETVERILRYFGVQMNGELVRITKRYHNQPK